MKGRSYLFFVEIYLCNIFRLLQIHLFIFKEKKKFKSFFLEDFNIGSRLFILKSERLHYVRVKMQWLPM